jgi:hypothetical protein
MRDGRTVDPGLPVDPPANELLIGLRWVQPTATDISNNPELAEFGSLGGNFNSLLAFETKLRTVSGWTDDPIIQMGHFYNGSGYSIADSYCSSMMSRYPAMCLNFKPPGGPTVANMNTTASGGHDSQIQSLIDSIPNGKRCYMVWCHEPDQTSASDVAAWRAGFVHWAKYIIDHRGTKDLHPTICLTTWSFRPANATVQARYLQVKDDLAAAGVDWVNDVVMGPDGYQDKAAGKTAADTYANVFPSLYAAGWRRFGISEFAAADKIGTIGTSTTTAADVAAADDWFKSVVTWVGGAPYNAEYLCWFAPTGSKGPIGDWMYSTALRTAFADAAHYQGPAPGW